MFRRYLFFLYTRVKRRNPKREILLMSKAQPWSICLLLQRWKDGKNHGRGPAPAPVLPGSLGGRRQALRPGPRSQPPEAIATQLASGLRPAFLQGAPSIPATLSAGSPRAAFYQKAKDLTGVTIQ